MRKIILLFIFATLFLIPIFALAEEHVKIKLPDGLYMYDSSIEKLSDGHNRVGFRTFFIIKSNVFYSSKEAIKTFGSFKIYKLFTEDKKYKILFGREKIGEIYNIRIDDDGEWNYEETLFNQNPKESPIYGKESIYLERLGSAAKFIGVPQKYKEVQENIYNKISKEEVSKISNLAKTQLFPLVKNVKCKILDKENLELVDKISDRYGELYIGVYRFVFQRGDGAYCENEITFSIRNDTVHFTTNKQNGETKICGMLDVDGDGKGELIIERTLNGEDWSITTLEIYKQKADGDWTLIFKLK